MNFALHNLQTGTFCVFLLGVAGLSRGAPRTALDKSYRQQLEKVAKTCDSLGLREEARLTRNWFVRRDPRRQYLFVHPSVHRTKPAKPASLRAEQWRARFLELREKRAASLFGLARQAMQAKRFNSAFRLVHEVLHEDPDHKDARRILGYRGGPGNWVKQGSRRTRKKRGTTRHRVLGWRARGYWRIDSEHFQISTNVDGKAGLELARQLEDLFAVWRQVFFEYWGNPMSLQKRFAGQDARLAPANRSKFKVVLFRDRADYVRKLGVVEPQIAKTVGYYLARKQTSFFYAGDASVHSTRFHEVTHQFFQERRRGTSDVGEQADFWIVEGVALYMESLQPYSGYYTLGGFDSNRLQFARHRFVSLRFYLPLGQLAELGREGMQGHQDLRRLYSQSTGLTHMLMDHERGRYRRGLMRYLTAVYRGRRQQVDLETALGVRGTELDRAYGDFLCVTENDFAFLRPPEVIRNLCLTRSNLSENALQRLHACPSLEWLDLSFTPVADITVTQLGTRRLRQLNLERTAISDVALKTIARMSNLEELDLSQTRVTDTGIANLKGLTGLKVLWLTKTQVSDVGLQHLRGLKKLELLDLAGTQVTPQARERLERELPNLERR